MFADQEVRRKKAALEYEREEHKKRTKKETRGKVL